MTGPAASDELSVQERLYPSITCFGCGHANPRGLRLQSFPDGDGVVASFTPWPEHDNGGGFLNGGIIATVLDCHTAAAMMMRAERMGLVAPGAGLLYVTAGLDVRYVRPTPLAGPLRLVARVTQSDPDRMTVAADLHADGKVRATAQADWRRWRPR
jgi:acyl-coenzyme A thioesterase PaaI-like protein